MSYKVSAVLVGHTNEVRDIISTDLSWIASGARDGKSILWKLTASSPPTYDSHVLSSTKPSKPDGPACYITAVTYISPSTKYPDGLIATGGQEPEIDVRQPTKSENDSAEVRLPGHGRQVSPLETTGDGRYLISGGWDSTVRIRGVDQWAEDKVVGPYESNCLAIVAYDQENIITGWGNGKIRIVNVHGTLLHEFTASDEPIRSLCRLPANHESGAHFASSGNDTIITLWTMNGDSRATLIGHQNHVYSLATLGDGTILSGSEDATVKAWKDAKCTQTIKQPNTGLWKIQVNVKSGDFAVTNGPVVRIFSESSERQNLEAHEAYLQEISGAKEGNAPQIDPKYIHEPEWLDQNPGYSQPAIIRRNGLLYAYTWDGIENKWVEQGEVQNGPEQTSSDGKPPPKTQYKGKMYDYVFSIIVSEGAPKIDLPYNITEDPGKVAQKFLNDHNLPQEYHQQIKDFIQQNSSKPTASEKRILPHEEFQSITKADIKVIHRKIMEYNKILTEEGSIDRNFNQEDERALNILADQLSKREADLVVLDTAGLMVLLRMCTTWPPQKRLPCLDMLRVAAAKSKDSLEHLARRYTPAVTVIEQLISAGAFQVSAPPMNTAMATRTIANFFINSNNDKVLEYSFIQVHSALSPHVGTPLTQNGLLAIAITTVYLNYAVLMMKQNADLERAFAVLEIITQLISNITGGLQQSYKAIGATRSDPTAEKKLASLMSHLSEALQTACLALGTVLTQDFKELRAAAKDVFGVGAMLNDVVETEGKVRDRVSPKITPELISEIRSLMTSSE